MCLWVCVRKEKKYSTDLWLRKLIPQRESCAILATLAVVLQGKYAQRKQASFVSITALLLGTASKWSPVVPGKFPRDFPAL